MAFSVSDEKNRASRAPVHVSDEDFKAFWDTVQNRVPYARHIDPKNARAWQERVLNDSSAGAHPLEWYIRRMGNAHGPLVGGSEIGILMSAARHLPAPFGKTPGILFDEKMMVSYQGSNVATRFGSEHEKEVADAFMEKVASRGWKRDEKALEVVMKYAKEGDFRNHLAYTPDDIFLLPNNQRFLIDYKIPYSGVIPQKEPFSYIAQLHQGKIVLEDQCGLQVDGMLLVYAEHPESLAKPESLNLHFFQVDFNENLAREIPVVAREFAQALMNNERPSVLDHESASRLKSLDMDYVWITDQIKALQEQADSIKSNMSEIMESLPAADITAVREETLSTPAVSYKVEDNDRLVALLQDATPELFGDAKATESWRKKGGVNVDKLLAYLEEQKVDLQPFMEPDTWDVGKIVKDDRVLASGALDAALSQGIVSRSISWRVSEKARLEAARLREEEARLSDAWVEEWVEAENSDAPILQNEDGFVVLDEDVSDFGQNHSALMEMD
jgi:outer membrane lipoprotein-sorting protein